ncbi:MAG: phosphate acetyltransferase [Candidatus Aminicenantes bacterium]
MADNLYVTSTEPRSGKSAISLGLMEMLFRNVDRVSFFRPFIHTNHNRKDNDINLISNYFKIDIPYREMYGYTSDEANRLISIGRYEELLEGIVDRYKALEQKSDFVLVEGTDFQGSSSAFEFDINADVANNLGCPVILVAKAHQKTREKVIQSIEISLDSLADKNCNVLAVFINRIDEKDAVIEKLKENPLASNFLIFTIPNIKTLASPRVGDVAEALNARVLYGTNQLNRHVENFGVAAMQIPNVLSRIADGEMVITPGDRADVIVACLSALSSSSMPRIAGMILTGGLVPEASILKLIEGYHNALPILSVPENTFEAARNADNVPSIISPNDTRKVTLALEAFEKNTDTSKLRERIVQTKVSITTPKMFEYRLIHRARSDKKRIVLPEGEEDRILRAAEILSRRDVAVLTLLGDEEEIHTKISDLELELKNVRVIDIKKSDKFEEYAQLYYEQRKHKGTKIVNARDNMTDPNYFGTMMVYAGDADGMVSGAIHPTRSTLRPSFEVIKTKSEFSIISSVFFMCLADRVLVYGDCAVNPEPDPRQLAEIAVSSAQTAKIFDIEPRVAMLSYSTGESGVGEDVDKVREATKLARELAKKQGLDIKIEGPIQYDAAIDPGVARTKLPDSEVAGRATVYIFPDLNTGNNTYKAVQRSANAVAIGPVIQGLNKPVNDLSRGCTVADIVNTVAITAIQAQEK